MRQATALVVTVLATCSLLASTSFAAPSGSKTHPPAPAAAAPQPPSVDPNAPRVLPPVLAKAKRLIDANRAEEALGLLRPFVASTPRPAQLDQAYLLLGAAQRGIRQYPDALATLNTLLAEFPDSPIRDRAKLLQAQIHTTLNHPDQALPLLGDIRGTTTDDATKREALAMTGTILSQKRESSRAIQAWLEEMELSPADLREDPLRRIRGLVEQMDRKTLAQVRDTYPTSFPGDLALIRLIDYHQGRNEDHLAERQLQLFLSRFPSHDYAAKAGERLDALTAKLRTSQAVLLAYLPLSGKLAPFGTEALNGVQLALENAKDGFGQQSVGLIVKDSGSGRPEHLQQVAQALDDYHPLAIIGPMMSKVLPPLADLAERAATPLITPAATLSDVRHFGQFTFSSSLTYPVQAKRLAEYASVTLGLKRFVILVPDAPYGRELAAYFSRDIAQLNGEIIVTETFKEGDADFGPMLKRVKALDLKKYGVMTPFTTSKGLKRDIYTPGFDAIFVPSRVVDMTLLAPQLLYHDMKVPLLGINSWNTPPQQAVADQLYEGSIFVDGFVADSRDPAVQNFVERYRARFQSEPGAFAAQAYDAASMVLDALRKGAHSGGDLREHLASAQDLPTLSGPAHFDESGTLARRLSVIGVKQRKLVPLE